MIDHYISFLIYIQALKIRLHVSHGGQGKVYSPTLLSGLAIGRGVAKIGSSVGTVPLYGRIPTMACPGQVTTGKMP
jgi:hypothetical protein